MDDENKTIGKNIWVALTDVVQSRETHRLRLSLGKSGGHVTLATLTLVIAIALVGLIVSQASHAASEKTIVIGSASKTGIYYPVAKAICRFVNKRKRDHGIHCTAEITKGSVYNLNEVRSGGFHMGLAQSDWHFHAYHGTGPFQGSGKFEGLRSIFSVHPEVVTVVARADSGIKALQDLEGKRISLSNWSTAMRDATRLFDAYGLSRTEFASVLQSKRNAEQLEELCKKRADALVLTVGHPFGLMKKRLKSSSCRAVLVPLSGPRIVRLVDQYSYYRRAEIPGGLYKGNRESVPTFGVGATLISSSSESPEIIYWVVKSVFENFEKFRKSSPALRGLKKTEMIRDSLTAPLHEGAERYYREAGLM